MKIKQRGDPVPVGPTDKARFTVREREVIGLLLKGLSSQQVADALGVKFYTATTHMKHIFKKLGIHRRAELFSMVLQGDLHDAHGRQQRMSRKREGAAKMKVKPR